MSDKVSKFELHRQQLAAGLVAVAKSMRNCAEIADSFSKVVADAHYSQEAVTFFQDASEATKGKRKAAHSPEDGEVPKKRKRNIKPKDPNAPKRPASSYLLFQNEVRKELKEQHPNLSNTDLLSMISEQWKKMSDDQKETYNQLMKTAKAVYSEEKKAYDSRNVAESEVANVANAATVAKTNPKPRKPKPSATAGSSAAKDSPAATARPPPKLSEVSHSSDTSDEEESEDEAPSKVAEQPEHGSELSEEESSEPSPKKRRSGSAKPNSHKSKRGSAA